MSAEQPEDRVLGRPLLLNGTEEDCHLVLERVHAFLTSELDEQTSDIIREHLHACEHCLDDFDVEQALRHLVNRTCTGPKAPPTLRVTITTMIAHYRAP